MDNALGLTPEMQLLMLTLLQRAMVNQSGSVDQQ